MATQYRCQNERRQETIRTTRGADGNFILNGIDYLEVTTADEKTLEVHFIHDLPPAVTGIPVPPAPKLTKANVIIEGGVRITPIVIDTVSTAANVLTVTVKEAGDYATYTL